MRGLLRTGLLLFFVALTAMGQVNAREIGNRAAPFERLQNDIGTAVAHTPTLSSEDRARLDRVNLVLGQAISDRTTQRKLNKKKVLAALKDIEAVEKTASFSAADRKALDEARKLCELAAKEPTEVRYVYVGKPGQPI